MVAKDTVANGKDTVEDLNNTKVGHCVTIHEESFEQDTMNNFNFDLLDDFDLLER